MRQFSPIVVLPRICANGSTIVSMPISTAESIVMVSGLINVTPAAITALRLRSRKIASTIGELRAVVDAERLAGVVDLHGLHAVAGARQDRGHVGQVIFARRVIGLDLIDVLPEEVGAETVDAHIGLADGELFRSAGLLLHHIEDVAVRIADHAAVARGVVHQGAHQHAGGAACGLLRRSGGAACSARSSGRIAVQDHQVAIQVRHGIAADHHRVARALLFGLLDKADAGAGRRIAALVRPGARPPRRCAPAERARGPYR